MFALVETALAEHERNSERERERARDSKKMCKKEKEHTFIEKRFLNYVRNDKYIDNENVLIELLMCVYLLSKLTIIK